MSLRRERARCGPAAVVAPLPGKRASLSVGVSVLMVIGCGGRASLEAGAPDLRADQLADLSSESTRESARGDDGLADAEAGTPNVDAAADRPADLGPDAPVDATAGESDGATDAGADGAPRLSTGCAPLGLLQSGTSPLVNAFPVPEGIIVVRAEGLTLLGRDRSVKATAAAAYMISTASFDGETVAVGDGSAVYFFSTALVPRAPVRVMDPCWDSVMAPGSIFVCEPARDRPLLFSTVDVKAGRLLKESPIQYLAGGRPMEGAAGTAYFALLSLGSPSNYGLYVVDADGTVRMAQGASTYQDPDLTGVFQFAGAPASHLLTSNGTLLRLLGPGCDGSATVNNGACLQQDGLLGTLLPRERFTALDSDGAGGLFGFVSHNGRSNLFDETPCTEGCALQKLDLPGRAVVAQQSHWLGATTILFMRVDPSCHMAVVGYKAPPLPAAPASYVYRVDLLDYLPSP